MLACRGKQKDERVKLWVFRMLDELKHVAIPSLERLVRGKNERAQLAAAGVLVELEA